MISFLSSNIGKKILMALTGLGLIVFLITHLLGNLLVFKSAEAFNNYSHSLITNPFILVAELGLLALFILHVVTAIIFTKKNREARPEKYHLKKMADHTSRKGLASSTMILSGLIVLIFVPLHLWDFKYGSSYTSAANPEVRDLHRLVLEEFSEPGEVIWYVVAMIVIGFHLSHGFGSAFESLGVHYRKGLRRFGQVLAVAIAGGFALIPVLLFFGK
jgi:succinate dehydrogenase / fumarate reductase cytochrome b subunit